MDNLARKPIHSPEAKHGVSTAANKVNKRSPNKCDEKVKESPSSTEENSETNEVNEKSSPQKIDDKKKLKDNRLYPGITELPDHESSQEGEIHMEPSIEGDERDKEQSFLKSVIQKLFGNSVLSNFICTILFLLLAIFICLFYQSSNSPVVLPKVDIKGLIKELKREFKEQQPLTFHILRASLGTLIAQKNSEPTAITFLIDKGAYNVAKEMSIHIVQKIAPSNNLTIKKKSNNPSKEKQNILKDIDEKFNKTVVDVGVVIVENFQTFELEPAMLFHDYCDENAHYKNIVYFFLICLDYNLKDNADVKTIDMEAENIFKKMWQKSHEDYYNSLITRLTVNVANIKNRITSNDVKN